MDNNGTQPPAPQDTQAPEAPDVQSTQTDDDEWEGATVGYMLDKGISPNQMQGGDDDTKRSDDNETDSASGDAAGSDDSGAKAGQKDSVSDDSAKSGQDDAGKNGEGDGDSGKDSGADADQEGASDDPVGNSQPTRSELEAERKEVIADLRKELYSDLPTELTDADGDPIRTIEDVQKLINPNTRQQFTEEEAAAWLLAAQQHLNKQIKEADERVEQIAETVLSLKDQTANVMTKYGALLEANPNGVREKVWKAYEKTLVKDPDTGVIIEAPVSLEEFYDTALEPYERLAAQMEADEANGQQQRQEQQRQQVAKQKTQARSDRQDIIGGGKTNTKDPEEAEWEQAARAYYEG